MNRLSSLFAGYGSTWHEFAPCRSTDPELFFPEHGQVPPAIRSLCASCPFQQACLDEAIAFGPAYGVWAGKTARQIRRIRVQRGLVKVASGDDETCVAGHDREGNTRVGADGRRDCIECEREATRRSREKRRGVAA